MTPLTLHAITDALPADDPRRDAPLRATTTDDEYATAYAMIRAMHEAGDHRDAIALAVTVWWSYPVGDKP